MSHNGAWGIESRDIACVVPSRVALLLSLWFAVEFASLAIAQDGTPTLSLDLLEDAETATLEPSELIFQALVERAKGENQKAIQLLGRALCGEVSDADVFLIRGQCWAAMGRPALAIRDLRQCRRLQPRRPLAHRTLGRVLLDSDRFREARDAFKAALRLDPHDAEAWDLLGRSWIGLAVQMDDGTTAAASNSRRRFFERAERAFDRSIACNRAYLGPLWHRCVVRAASGKYRAAARDLRMLVMSDGNRGAWLAQIGSGLAELGEHRMARFCLARGRSELEKGATRSQVVRSLAEIYVLEGAFKAARSLLEEAVTTDPLDLQARLWLGDIAMVDGNLSQAAEHYQSVLESEDIAFRERALLALSRLLFVRGDDEIAYGLVSAGVEAGFNSPGLLELLGTLAESRGEVDVVASSFEALLSRAREDPSSFDNPHYLRALAARMIQSKIEGVSDLETACSVLRALSHLRRDNPEQFDQIESARNAKLQPEDRRRILSGVLEHCAETVSGTAVKRDLAGNENFNLPALEAE